MRRTILCLFLLVGSAFGQTDKSQIARLKKDADSLRAAVGDAVNAAVTGQRTILEGPKATYLDGYGVVVSVEIQLEPAWNPFSGVKTPAEIKTIVANRRKDLQEKLDAVLKQHAGAADSLGEGESMSVVVHLFNSNPVVLPDLPSQVVFTARKQDPSTVTHREF